jgi:aminopeptidase N
MVKVKILILLAAISIVVAIPLKSKKETPEKAYRNLMMKKFVMREDQHQSFESFRESMAEAEKLSTVNFRLPNSTIPLHYNVRITTNVDAGDFQFFGLTRVTFRVLETTSTVTLHAMQMFVQRIDLLNSNLNLMATNLNFRTDSITQFLEVISPIPLQAGQEFTLEFAHSGNLRTDRLGLYRTSYNDRESGRAKWIASTLFEPTHARHAFPCYDEIRYRTTFDIAIVHSSTYHVLSNMPVAQTQVNGERTTTIFERTLAMPTYNVAFTISDFDFISNGDEEKLPIRIYAQPADIAAGRADVALKLSGEMWSGLEGIFEIPYPLPKSDVVAINNWRNGEAWGLLKINDWDLVSSEGITEWWRRMQIAHEYSVSGKFCSKWRFH